MGLASEMSPADIAAVTGNNNGSNGFGYDGSWWLIVLFLFAILGWGNNGYGNNGGTMPYAVPYTVPTGNTV